MKQVSSNSLLKAADRGDLNRVKKLVNEEKNDPMQTSKYGGYSALHYAARKGKLNIIIYLIEREGCNPSPESSLKETPLHIAAQYGQLETVKYLVCDQSADPCDQDQHALNALHHACIGCLLYTSPSPRDATLSRMPSSA